MLDFHISISPGANALLPGEALHLAVSAGCRAAGLVVRSDGSNLNGADSLASISVTLKEMGIHANIRTLLGVELVFVPPALLPEAVIRARLAGADYVLVQGESLGLNVPRGTNFAAVQAGADILACPGLVDEPTARYAAEKGTAFEFCAVPRHALSNAHVAKLAEQHNVLLVQGSGAVSPHELPGRARWRDLYSAAALNEAMSRKIINDSQELLNRLLLGEVENHG